MASMELTPAEASAEAREMKDWKPRWAISETYLDKQALEALGITQPMKPGTMLQISGLARVVSSSLRDDGTGEEENCMSMQIVEMTVAPAERQIDAKSMFPNSKMEA